MAMKDSTLGKSPAPPAEKGDEGHRLLRGEKAVTWSAMR
jgi:hypothetical protein